MDSPPVAWRVAQDAARLVGEGELVVFGSAALAFWLGDPPQSRDVDVWTTPPEKGEAIEALMGELSWYHEKFSIHAEVWLSRARLDSLVAEYSEARDADREARFQTNLRWLETQVS